MKSLTTERTHKLHQGIFLAYSYPNQLSQYALFARFTILRYADMTDLQSNMLKTHVTTA